MVYTIWRAKKTKEKGKEKENSRTSISCERDELYDSTFINNSFNILLHA